MLSAKQLETETVTTRTRSALLCECGHQGCLECRETDHPHGGLWEEYSLSGFGGGGRIITSCANIPKDMLAAPYPTCPQCGLTGRVRYLESPRSTIAAACGGHRNPPGCRRQIGAASTEVNLIGRAVVDQLVRTPVVEPNSREAL